MTTTQRFLGAVMATMIAASTNDPSYSLFATEFCDKHIHDLAAATMHVAKLTLCETP